MSRRERCLTHEGYDNVIEEARETTDQTVPLDVLAAEDEPELRRKIGQHLGAVRKQLGRSQEIAAAALEMSRPHLSNVENGRSGTSWGHLKRMAKYYTQDIEKLIIECRSPDYDAPPLPQPKAQKSEENGIGPFKAYTAHNLTSYEKFVMSGFHILPQNERDDLMQEILRRYRSHLSKPDQT